MTLVKPYSHSNSSLSKVLKILIDFSGWVFIGMLQEIGFFVEAFWPHLFDVRVQSLFCLGFLSDIVQYSECGAGHGMNCKHVFVSEEHTYCGVQLTLSGFQLSDLGHA